MDKGDWFVTDDIMELSFHKASINVYANPNAENMAKTTLEGNLEEPSSKSHSTWMVGYLTATGFIICVSISLMFRLMWKKRNSDRTNGKEKRGKADVETLQVIPEDKEVSSECDGHERPMVYFDMTEKDTSKARDKGVNRHYPRNLKIPITMAAVDSLSTIAEASVETDRTCSYIPSLLENDDEDALTYGTPALSEGESSLSFADVSLQGVSSFSLASF